MRGETEKERDERERERERERDKHEKRTRNAQTLGERGRQRDEEDVVFF
jgi:hypothetical protein